MFNKIFNNAILGVLVAFLFTGTCFAANSTSIRIQQPGSPTDQDSFKITFVALDLNNSTVSVQCLKKGPSDGSFVSFGSAISLSAGGNTDSCSVDSGILSSTGTYQFYATAVGSSSVTSNTVSVDYNGQAGGPGVPINYSKAKPDNCTYKISFRTANDSGKTVKVVLYHSTDAVFNTDQSHKVNTLNIGSDTDGSIIDNITPNCDNTYYYAIRAFDVYGNGSVIAGDENITTVTTNTTNTSTQQGAILVNGQNGMVLGTKIGETDSTKEVLGATESAEVAPEVINVNSQNWILTHKKISLLVLTILAVIGYFVLKMRKKKLQ
jgi:hypothetical protein